MILRKLGAVVAVSTLGLMFALGGAGAASAAPVPPTVDQTFPDPWITDGTQPQVQGNMALGVVQIDVEASPDGTNFSPYCTVATNPAATVWFCSSPTGTLPLGVNYIRATATDAIPETSAPGAPITITIVNTPTITSPADGLVTNDYQPTFIGAAEGSFYDVYSSDFVTHFCGGTVVNLMWNCTSGTLADGDYTYLVQSTFGATTIYSATRTLRIDTTLTPANTDINGPPGVDDGFGKWLASSTDPNPTITGTAEPLSTITMWQDYTQVYCQGGAPVADGSGNWSCTLAVALPTSGIYVFGSQHTDPAGNTNVGGSPDEQLQLTYTDITPPLPPVVTSPLGVVSGGMNIVTTNNTAPTITGTGEPGATLNVVGNSCLFVPTTVDASGDWSCQLTTPMSPDGNYDVFFGLTDAAFNSSPLASPGVRFSIDTVLPGTPTVSAPAGPSSGGVIRVTTLNTHLVIQGSGEIGATVRIYVGASTPVSCAETLVVDAGGNFQCTVSGSFTPGTYNFSFAQTDVAGNSSGSAVTRLRFTVASPPAPAPASPALALAWFLKFTADSASPAPGQVVTLTGSDLPPGALVSAELHSTPLSLGTTVVRDDGTFVIKTVIPDIAEPGEHHYVVTVTPAEGAAQTSEIPVTVLAPPPPSEPAGGAEAPTNIPESSTGGVGQNSSSLPQRNTPAAPNSLSQSLTTLQEILSNPLILAAAAASSLALLFLVAFPAELLNSTLDENYQRIFGKFRRTRVSWFARLRAALKRAPAVGGLALTTVAALVLSFSDPHFGFDLASLRLFLACAIGMFVLGYVANALTALILRRRWRISSVIELQPFGLLVALAGVLLSRVLDFTPGLLIGLVLALSLSASATLKEESRAVLLWAGAVLGLAVLSWVTYSLVTTGAVTETFGGALAQDSLVAIATEGVSGLVIGLLPLGFLDGRSVFRHSKWQWLGTYLATLVAFFMIVVPSGALWGNLDGPFWLWIIVLLAFAVLCVGVYLWFRSHPEVEDESSSVEASSDGSETGSRHTKSLQK